MKKQKNSSVLRLMSIVTLPVIIPIWAVGWILSCINCQRKSTTKNCNKNKIVIQNVSLNNNKT